MSFSWIAFLNDHGVYYRTEGPNVSKGHIAVKCPFCGHADPSEHMSVSKTSSGWRCWRNPTQHSGLKPHRLMIALTGISAATADALVGDSGPSIAQDFLSQIFGLVASVLPPVTHVDVELPEPKEWRTFKNGMSAAYPYITHITKRGISMEGVADYGLGMRYAISGSQQGRVIFPVRSKVGQLVGWTGRSISSRATLRYKDEGPIKNYLWGEPLLERGGHALVVTEGPFDALKLSILGHGTIRATCVFASYPSALQKLKLVELQNRYDGVVALFDRENEQASIRLCQELPFIKPVFLPEGIKDPGDLAEIGFLR